MFKKQLIFFKFIKYKPDYAGAHNNLGISYMKKGLNNKAIQSFNNFKKYWKGDKKKIEDIDKIINELKKN